MGRYRVTIQEAAKRLGVKEGAIRKRIERKTIRSEKDAESGRVFVYVNETPTEGYDTGHDEGYDMSYAAGYDTLVRSQQEQIEFLRRELERKDAILLNMTEAMKALNPPSDTSQNIPPEPRESPQTASEEPSGTQTPARGAALLVAEVARLIVREKDAQEV
jgi:excisionase family DNA binding protein